MQPLLNLLGNETEGQGRGSDGVSVILRVNIRIANAHRVGGAGVLALKVSIPPNDSLQGPPLFLDSCSRR